MSIPGKTATGVRARVTDQAARVVHAGRCLSPAVVTSAAVVYLTGTVSAHTGAGPSARVDDLFTLLVIISLIIAGLVHVALFMALWLFRRGSERERGVPRTENRALEIAWTAAPAVTVAVIALLSAQALIVIDEAPRDALTIKVTGEQWVWKFEYPDGNFSLNEMRVEQGQVVVLEVTSTDVIHSLFIPDLNLKVDAFPNRTTRAWFIAEEVGSFDLSCAEFCGSFHDAMKGRLVIFERGVQARPYGDPPTGEGPGGGDEVAGEVMEVELLESGGSEAGRPWSIDPERIEIAQGQAVSMRVLNNGSGFHNFTIGAPYNLVLDSIPSGTYAWLNFTADEPTTSTDYWCAVPGHRQLGMAGVLTVVPSLVLDMELLESGGPSQERPWSIYPPVLELETGTVVSLRIWNNGSGFHNLTIGPPYDLEVDSIPSGTHAWLNFTADEPTPSTDYWCAVPGHRQLGMEGLLIVGAGDGSPPPGGRDSPVTPWAVILTLAMFAVVGITIALALRPRKAEVRNETTDGRHEETGEEKDEGRAGDDVEEDEADPGEDSEAHAENEEGAGDDTEPGGEKEGGEPGGA